MRSLRDKVTVITLKKRENFQGQSQFYFQIDEQMDQSRDLRICATVCAVSQSRTERYVTFMVQFHLSCIVKLSLNSAFSIILILKKINLIEIKIYLSVFKKYLNKK